MYQIPSSAIGSIPRDNETQFAMVMHLSQQIGEDELDMAIDKAVRETVSSLEEVGSSIVGDGEQSKSSFATYPLDGLRNLSPSGGVVIPFADGHSRNLPRLSAGPFKYAKYAGSFVPRTKKYANRPVKQSVIAASAMSLLYPEEGIPDYPREQFIADLIQEATNDIRSCLEAGASQVQIDFTEGRLAVKLDPSKQLLQQFIDLNNQVLANFTEEELKVIGFHTCPGADHDSTHSLDVPYEEFIPTFLQLNTHNFFMQMASEEDPTVALKAISKHLRPYQRIYVGVIDVVKADIETPEQVCESIIQAAQYIPIEQLGTTDDCGFSPFCDDMATSRSTAFAKIKARIDGTRMANEFLANDGKLPPLGSLVPQKATKKVKTKKKKKDKAAVEKARKVSPAQKKRCFCCRFL